MCENTYARPKFDLSMILENNAMLKVRPELFDEWDFRKNNELGLNIYKATKGSHKVVWWICSKCSSSFNSQITDRTRGNNCPFCASQRVNHTNSLATLRPDLANEWHPLKNGELTPNDVLCGSGKKVWWKCQLGHEWEAVVNNRIKGQGCPYCSGRRVIKGYSDLYTTNPEMEYYWNKEKNTEIKMSDVTKGSHIEAWWKCDKCKSDFKTEIILMVKYFNCPYCSGKRVNSTNSLASLNPSLASEWHPTKNDDLTPHNVTCNNGNKVWWLGECGHEWDAKITSRHNGIGCPYCSRNPKALNGYNDMWTTNPELASLLANPEDGYKYTQSSGKKVNWKCSDCGTTIKSKSIDSIKKQGLSCFRCSDGRSFGERYMYSLLTEIGVDFECEKVFKWNKNRRYDFIIKYDGQLIISEIHGLQHYETCYFHEVSGMTLEEQIKIDEEKKYKALSNGIDYYFEIDAKVSNDEYLKSSIINSGIFNKLKIEDRNINWLKVSEGTSLSFIKRTSDLWNKGMSIKNISEKLKLNRNTISEYLIKGNKLGLCSYQKKPLKAKIVQLNKENVYIKEWDSIIEASKVLNITSSMISSCCNNRQKTAGGYKWLFSEVYEDYLSGNMASKTLSNNHGCSVEVVRIDATTDKIEIYESIKLAAKYNDLKSSAHISSCCRGKRKSAYGYRWMYLEDYEKQYGKIDE